MVTAARATIADMITAAVIGAPTIRRSRARVKKAPALRIDHHRRAERPDSAVFRIRGLEFIKLLFQLSGRVVRDVAYFRFPILSSDVAL